MTPILEFDNLLQWLPELRKVLSYYYFITKDILKETMSSQMKRSVGWGLEGSWAQELQNPWSLEGAIFLTHGCGSYSPTQKLSRSV